MKALSGPTTTANPNQQRAGLEPKARADVDTDPDSEERAGFAQMLPCTSQRHSSSVKTRSARAILHRRLTSSSQHKRQGKMTDSLWLSPSGTSQGSWEGSEAPGPPLHCLHRHPARAPRASDRSAGEARGVRTGSNQIATRPLRILLLQRGLEKSLQNSDRISFSRKIRTHSSSHLSHLGVHHRPGGSAPHHPGRRAASRGSSPLAAIVPSTRERCSSFWTLVLGSSSHLPTRSCWAAGLRAVGCVPATSP